MTERGGPTSDGTCARLTRSDAPRRQSSTSMPQRRARSGSEEGGEVETVDRPLLGNRCHPWRDRELRLIQQLVRREGLQPITCVASRLQRRDDRLPAQQRPVDEAASGMDTGGRAAVGRRGARAGFEPVVDPQDCVHMRSPRHFSSMIRSATLSPIDGGSGDRR